jgi:ribose-phosphate pyrophosphokinase
VVERRPLRLVAGRGNQPLAAETARLLGVALTAVESVQFPDTETYVRLLESVRGEDVFVLQPTAPPVNDNLVELLLLIDALRRASAGRVTAVIPYFGYARQERKAKGREAISAKVVADVLTSVGANRVITVDIHAPAMQGFFNIPMDSLSAIPLVAGYLRQRDLSDTVIVAPDAGRARWADKYGELLGRPIALMHKRRGNSGQVEVAHVVGDVRGRRPIVVDDIIAGGSVIGQLPALVEAGARPEITLAIIHGVLVGNSLERLADPLVRELIVTDTVQVPPAKRLPKLTVLSVAPLLAEAIRRTHADESVSPMFQVM